MKFHLHKQILITVFTLSTIMAFSQNTKWINETDTKIVNNIKVYKTTSKPVTGIIYKKYENGNQKIVCEYKNGLKNGAFKTWYENGNKELESHYIDNVLNGVCKKWYESGNLEIELYYDNGTPNGSSKEWFENGQLKIEYYMISGKPSGLIKTWYESGMIRSEAMIKEGKEIYHKCWDENGSLKDCK